ncbi:PAS domain-containing protein [Aromatoleum evansii]|uniref:PAS domain-containing protein n=1 Tax=Aromatoleum evansii TaxID=59406 RepID=UPI00145DE294|nr:PAS domain-containing protein [Aromatoleum evansii]
MYAATCPLADDSISSEGFSPPHHLAAAAAAEGARHGIVVLDTHGIVRFCTTDAAQVFGGEVGDLVGRPVASLVAELKLRRDTPGYNVAYALFCFPRQQWRTVQAMTHDGRPFLLELSISLARIDRTHHLLLSVCRSRVRARLPPRDLAPTAGAFPNQGDGNGPSPVRRPSSTTGASFRQGSNGCKALASAKNSKGMPVARYLERAVDTPAMLLAEGADSLGNGDTCDLHGKDRRVRPVPRSGLNPSGVANDRT